MYLKIENEFNDFCKDEDGIKFSSNDDNEKKNLEFNLSLTKKDIKDIDAKRKKLQEYVYKTLRFSIFTRHLINIRVHIIRMITEMSWKKSTKRLR